MKQYNIYIEKDFKKVGTILIQDFGSDINITTHIKLRNGSVCEAKQAVRSSASKIVGEEIATIMYRFDI